MKIATILFPLNSTQTLFAALLLVTSCTTTSVRNPYLEAQPYRQYAAKADVWLLRSQQRSGLLPYFFRPSTASEKGNSYQLGQLIAAERLARLARDRSGMAMPATKQLRAILKQWPELADEGRLQSFPQSNLGVRAFWLRVLLSNSKPANERVDTIARKLRYRFDTKDGFRPPLNRALSNPSFMQRYYTGHAALALFEHAEATDDQESLKTAEASLKWLETNYPMKDKANFHPTLVPWHAFAIAAQYRINGASPHLETLFVMSDQLVKLQTERDFPGRFFNPKEDNFGRPNVVRDALSTLTLMTSLDIAIEMGDRKLQKQYRKAIWLALDNLRSLQYDHGVVTNFDQPMKAIGALRFRHDDERIRLDGVIFGAEAFERAAIMIQNGKL